MDLLSHSPPQICIESHYNVKFSFCIHLKAYLRQTELFGRQPDGSCIFADNSRQCSLVYVKLIFPWVRMVLAFDNVHMSPGATWGPAEFPLG